jgi:HlyD family secretion protein
VKRFVIALVVLALAGAGYFAYARAGRDPAARLDVQTAPLGKGDVRRVVSTSGSVKPRVSVDVGTQISGQISELGTDFNGHVAKGDVIARIDPATFETKVRQAVAAVAVADAGVALAEAGIVKANANLAKAVSDLDRAKALAATGTGTKVNVDNAESVRATAAADQTTATAQLANAKALAQQRRAELESARIDLDRTVIRAPIDGVVVDRTIEVGQTVSASLSAPKLFTLAEDLAKVEIDAQVDEADIGQVAPGNSVGFTVDAFPDADFTGTVDQIRLTPTTASNVVTYTVVILADNPRGRLLPGMTANVEIVTGVRNGVIVVPNEALRFQPRGTALALVRQGPAEGPAAAGRPGAGRPGGADPLARLQQALGLDEATVARIRDGIRREMADLRPAGAQTRNAGGPAGQRRQPAGGDGAPAGGPAQSGPEAGEGGDSGQQRAAQGRTQFQEQLRARTEKVLREVLTPEQFEKYEELARTQEAAPRFGTVWTRESDGKLVAHRVRLGLADTSRSEIIGAELKEGDPIVLRVREQVR